MQTMARDIKALKATALRANAAGDSDASPRQQKFTWHLHGDGMHRRVPPTWTFPNLSLQHMYQQWHCGNEVKKTPPMRYFTAHDVTFPGI